MDALGTGITSEKRFFTLRLIPSPSCAKVLRISSEEPLQHHLIGHPMLPQSLLRCNKQNVLNPTLRYGASELRLL